MSDIGIQELPELDASAFAPLIGHLTKRQIPINKYRKGVGIGRSQCYGMVRKRSMAPDLSRCSWEDPQLHHLLMKFALVNMPLGFTFTSIQVNDSYKCAAHKDKHNVGNSYIVGFGNYTGGELVLHQGGGLSQSYQIRHRPILFDGSKIEHETKDWEGRRWTIVFHTLESPKKFPMIRKLSDYEAVTKDGTYVIAWYKEGEPTQYLSKKNGLPHPLKGRKVKKPEAALLEDDPNLTTAQNLMLRSKITGEF
jgi:hypothetical protein